MRVFFFIAVLCSVIANSVSGQTIESVMRALQERHMAVEQKKYVHEKYQNFDPITGELVPEYYEPYVISPIQWAQGLSKAIGNYPDDGALDSLSMADKLTILNRINDNYNALIPEYVFPANSPQLGALNTAQVKQGVLDRLDAINEGNYAQRLRQLGSGINQMRYLQWEHITQYLDSSGSISDSQSSSTSINLNAISDALTATGRVGRYWVYPDYTAFYWVSPPPSPAAASHLVENSYHIANGIRAVEYGGNAVYGAVYGSSVDGHSFSRTLITTQNHLGFLVYTGHECTAALTGQFVLAGRQMPLENYLSGSVSIPSGTWPSAYEEFKGYRPWAYFSGETDTIKYGTVDDAAAAPTDINFALGDTSGSASGSWVSIHRSRKDNAFVDDQFVFIPSAFTPTIGDWQLADYGTTQNRSVTTPNRLAIFQASDGFLMFAPQFQYQVVLPEASKITPLPTGSGGIFADMCRQMAYVDMGRGLDGVARGYLGFRGTTGADIYSYQPEATFSGFGAMIALTLFSNPGQFEIYYDSNVGEVPGGVRGVMSHIYQLTYEVDFGTPTYYAPGIEWYLYPRIKQIVGLDVIANIEAIGSGANVDIHRYYIKLYRASQKGAFSNGQYAVIGDPFDTIEVHDDGPSGNSSNTVSLVGLTKKITIGYATEAVDAYWKNVDTGEELNQYLFKTFQTIKTEAVGSGSSPIIEEAFDQATFKYTRKENSRLVAEATYPYGFFQTALSPESIIYQPPSVTLGASTPAPETVTYAGYNRVQSTTGPGWFWQDYDNYGRVTKRIDQLGSNAFPASATPWPDSSNLTTENTYADNTETTVTQRAGAVTGKAWRVWNGLTQVSDYVAADLSVSNYGDAGNLKTTTFYYGGGETAAGAEPWSIKAVVYSDQTASVYHYAYDSSAKQRTVTVMTGKPDSVGAPTTISKGTQTVTITNQQGWTLSTITTDIESGSVLASAITPSAQVDAFGRPTEVDYLDGTKTLATYYPDMRNLVQTATDRNGVVSTYSYDVLDRVATTVRAGVTTTNTPNGLTTTTTSSSSATGSRAVSSTTDLFGQLLSATNAFEPATSTAVAHTNGQFTATTTETVSGQTLIKTSAEDGSLVSIGGTGTLPCRYEYGVEAFNGPGAYAGKTLSFTKQIQLTDSGGDSATYVKTYADGAGRTVVVETPSATGSGPAYAFSYYNAGGQLWKTTDPDGVVTLFAYDEQGNRTTVALDVNKNDLIDAVAGVEDQVATTVTTYAGGNATTVTTVGLGATASEVSRSVAVLATGATTVTRNGNNALVTTLTPDIPNKKITVAGADGSAIYAFDSNGQPKTATIKDTTGTSLKTTSYAHDDFGRLQQTTGTAAGASLTTTFNPDGTVATGSATGTGVTSQAFSVAYSHPNAHDRMVVTNTTAGTSQALEVTGKGDLVERSGFGTFNLTLNTVRNGNGTTATLTTTAGSANTTFSANAAGVSTAKTFTGNTAGPATGYSAGGLPTALTTPAGANAVYGYGSSEVERGLVKTITYPANTNTTNVALGYDAQGRVKTITDASGTRTLTYANDQLATETYSSGPLSGLVITRSFDGQERRQGLTLALNTQTLYAASYGYQGATRLLENVTKGTWSSHYTYKPDTQLIDQIVQKRGATPVLTTTRDYDAYQRLHAITSVAGSATTSYTYRYNTAGKRDRITRENGDYWSIGYQTDGQLNTAVKTNSGGTAYPGYSYGYSFTGIGSRSQIATNARTATYTPNALNQVTGRQVPGFVDVLGSVNALTNVTVDVRNQASPVAKKGAWTSSTAGGGFNGAGYLQDGNTNKGACWVDYSLVVPPGAYTVETMSSAGATNAASVPVTLDAGGVRQTRFVNQQTGGGAWVAVGTCTMTSGGRLSVRIGNTGTTGRVVADAVRLTRPADGWTQVLDSENAVPVSTVTAANAGGLFNAAIPVDNSAGPVAVAFDITGTLSGAGHNGTAAIATAQTSAILPPATTSLSNDLDGRRQGDWKWIYTWNAAGQLRSVESTAAYVGVGGPQLKLVFDYDAQGRRFSKKVYRDGGTAPTDTLYFVYDGWNLIAELNDSLAVVRSYTWGPDITQHDQDAGGIGGLLSIHVGTTTTYFPTYDGSGNITGLVDAATSKTAASYEYAPFGEPVRVSGVAASASPFGFSTKYTDKETGFCYYGHRYYDPELGHWLNREPMGEMESANLYAFCGNDPVNNVDYLGLKAVMVIRNSAIYERVKSLQAKGLPMYQDTILLKGFNDDDSANLWWMTSLNPQIKGYTDKENKLRYDAFKLVKNDAIWFFDDQEQGQAIKNYFDGFTWISIYLQVAPVVISAGTAGLGGGDLLSPSTSISKVFSNTRPIPRGILFEGRVYRYVKSQYAAEAWDITKYNISANYRYTRSGAGGVYMSTSKEALLGEIKKYDPKDVYIVSKEIHVDDILDLTNPGVRSRLGVSIEDLIQHGDDAYYITQKLGDFASRNYNGMLVPSANALGASNLIIFP